MTEALDTLERLMRERRSERQFLPEPLDPSVIERLLALSATAPSASNRQPYRFMVVVERELKEQMAEAVKSACSGLGNQADLSLEPRVLEYRKNFVFFSSAPVVVVVFFRAQNLLGNALCADSSRGPISEVREGLSSASAAIMQLLLAVHAMGLGACWMTGPCIAEEELLSLLKAPIGWNLAALVPIGKIAESSAMPRRKSLAQLTLSAPEPQATIHEGQTE